MNNNTTHTLIILFILICVLLHAIHSNARDRDTGVWLARSCIGEAGWKAHATGECAAIAHVYKKRTALNGYSMYRQIRTYSAAVKKHANQKNPWLFHLKRDAVKPKKWPKNLNWDNYKSDWIATLNMCDAMLVGDVSDPVPEALIYGSSIDRPQSNLKLIKTDFRNRFYKLKGATND